MVFEQAEWRKFGDKLFDEVISDNKVARKLMKPWRAVTNALATHQAEQKIAAAITEQLGSSSQNGGTSAASSTQQRAEEQSYPSPPSYRTVIIPQGTSGGWETSVPVSGEEEPSQPPTAPPAQLENGERVGGESGTNSFSTNPFKSNLQDREETWKRIAHETMKDGNIEIAAQITTAFPVVYSPPDAQGNVQAQLTNLDWKLLTQLRSTVNESGLKGEPTRQMLDYIWGTNILLPGDIRSTMKLILTQHQQLLFNAHWHSVCQEAVAMIRAPGDPLYGVTLDELMSMGPYFRTEAQALLGPDKAKVSMNLARRALEQIREPGGIPSYMGIKQGREEPFGLFIDRVANAIQAAGVPDYLKGTILKQCALQNCNPSTRSILAALPSTWTIEEGLERMSQVPVGPQAMLVKAVKQLGDNMNEQSKVPAALAPLQTPGGRSNGQGSAPQRRCFRCGIAGHIRRECKTESVWCQNCQSNTHSTSACRRGASGNGRSSGKSRPATTQKAAFATTAATAPAPSAAAPSFSDQPPEGASAWIGQQ
ncbi:endogenous retrovirus group K member 7 Gag polyprotein-like [Aythya fuligula]|uniref:Endogenous retrovirus group K member 7 Gag polyprotein-like n=1 Tax=Aythya fuligula TaxID=219594 RepID=A0A6J3EES4_AYTFU|nr:endogenous retrovirus group K member 7 Gag polyprotein-like [Aythya fuligula]